MTWQIELRIVLADGTAEDVVFQKDTIGVGRSPGSDIVLMSGTVARRHCELTVDDTGCLRVTDLASTNGTSVGGIPVDGSTVVPPGTPIRITDFAITLLREPIRVDG